MCLRTYSCNVHVWYCCNMYDTVITMLPFWTLFPSTDSERHVDGISDVKGFEFFLWPFSWYFWDDCRQTRFIGDYRKNCPPAFGAIHSVHRQNASMRPIVLRKYSPRLAVGLVHYALHTVHSDVCKLYHMIDVSETSKSFQNILRSCFANLSRCCCAISSALLVAM